MKLLVAAYTDKGLYADTNQDRILIGKHILESGTFEGEISPPCFLSVCDGCGGYEGGELASTVIQRRLSEENPGEIFSLEDIQDALEDANKYLIALKQKMPQYNEMKTTIAGVFLMLERVIVYHAGDSRVYRKRGDYLMRLTKDHSMAQELSDFGGNGTNSQDMLSICSTITRYLGDTMCDPPELRELKGLKSGDIYLLCTDGLWSAVDEETMSQMITDTKDISFLRDELVKQAYEGGTKDNVSLCLVKVVDEI